MSNLVRDFDWSKTILGPLASWNRGWTATVNLILYSPLPMLIIQGQKGILVYNDAYAEFAGAKHPEILGQEVAIAWPEAQLFLGEYWQKVLNGETISSKDKELTLYRNNVAEQVWVDLSYSPLLGESGEIDGVLAVLMETTYRVSAERKKSIAEEALRKSEERLSLALEVTEDGVWEWDASTQISFWTPRVYEMLGYDPQEVSPTFAFFEKILHPQDKDKVTEAFMKALQEGTLYEVEYRVKHKAGYYISFHAKGKPILDANGKVTRMVGIFVSTQKKESENALKESEQRFQAAIAAIEGILWTNSAEGQMEGLQPGWSFLTGQTYEEYQGYGWSNAVHQDDAQASVDAWNEAVRERKTFEYEHRVKLKNGEWGIFSVRAIPLLDARQNIREWVGVHTNITEQKRAEQALKESELRYRKVIEELERKNAELIRINNDLDTFIYTASHDLKAPMSNIEGLLFELREELLATIPKLEEGTSFLLQLMETSVERFKETIIDLTEISKVQKLQEDELVNVWLTQIVEDVKVSIHEQIKESKAVIETDFSEVEVVRFAKKNLKSVIYNLISNGIKYCDPSRPPHVLLKTQRMEGFTLLSVQDNGLGIPEENQEKMFTMFKRFHSHVEGTGVGLYIVKRILQNGGGKIEVESDLGTGTIFKVYLKE